MGSKTIAYSSKRSGTVKDAHKRLETLEGLTDNTQSKMDISSCSEDQVLDDNNFQDNQTESDEEVNEEMDDMDEASSSDEGDEGESGLDDKEDEVRDNMSDSSDDNENRTMEDGVDFSDSDNNDLEDDEEKQNAEGGESNDIKVAANPAWAQAMAKILRSQKPSGKKGVALSKARTIQAAESATAHKEDEPEFEIVGETEGKPQTKPEDVKPTTEELLQAKRERLAQCRVKQEDFDYNRERALTKIATKGVVQLFNAVRSQQKNIGSKLAEAHSTRMEEKLLKSIDKNSFLEHLTGKIRSRPVESVAKPIKKEDVEIVLPKSWDELSKKVESSSWDKVIEIKEEPED